MARTRYIFLAISVLIFSALACNALLPPPKPEGTPTQIIEPIFTQSQDGLPLTEANVPRVPVEEAKVAFESGAAIIVDVRSKDSHAASHIPGALSIPLEEFEANPIGLELDKAQWIITYCT